MDYIITALISYLFGSIPFGYIFTKIFLKKENDITAVQAVMNYCATAAHSYESTPNS